MVLPVAVSLEQRLAKRQHARSLQAGRPGLQRLPLLLAEEARVGVGEVRALRAGIRQEERDGGNRIAGRANREGVEGGPARVCPLFVPLVQGGRGLLESVTSLPGVGARQVELSLREVVPELVVVSDEEVRRCSQHLLVRGVPPVLLVAFRIEAEGTLR